jgi:hypothetical protein
MRNIAVTAIGTLLCLPVAAQAELVVNISKAQQQLSVVVDGETAHRWTVSTGRARYPTPAGKFRPIRLEKDWYSRKYNMTPMPFSVFFHRGYAVHGTLETKKLGRPVSHGCVRLLPANASILFALVREHGFGRTRFVVMNGPLPRGSVPKPLAPSPAPRPPSTDAPIGVAEASENAQSHVIMASHRRDEAPVQLALRHDAAAEDGADRTDVDAVKDVATEAPAEPQAALPVPAPKAPPRVRVRTARLDNSVSVGSEAQVLRERQAWLRAIDRKYGIAN